MPCVTRLRRRNQSLGLRWAGWVRRVETGREAGHRVEGASLQPAQEARLLPGLQLSWGQLGRGRNADHAAEPLVYEK